MPGWHPRPGPAIPAARSAAGTVLDARDGASLAKTCERIKNWVVAVWAETIHGGFHCSTPRNEGAGTISQRAGFPVQVIRSQDSWGRFVAGRKRWRMALAQTDSGSFMRQGRTGAQRNLDGCDDKELYAAARGLGPSRESTHRTKYPFVWTSEATC